MGCTPSKGDRCLAGLGVDFVDGKLEMLFGKVDQPGGFFVDSVKPGVTGASVFAEPLVSYVPPPVSWTPIKRVHAALGACASART